MKITVHKAQRHRADSDPYPDLLVEAVDEFPELDDVKAATALHDRDAAGIVSGLLSTLPGGTVDAVLRQLLEHRASLLPVRWPQ